METRVLSTKNIDVLRDLILEAAVVRQASFLGHDWERRERPGIREHYIRKGERTGLKEGREEGFHEGVLKARRHCLLYILSSRFGPVEKKLRARILRSED